MSFYHSNWIVDVLFIMVGFYTSYVLSGLLCKINLTESFYIDMDLTAKINERQTAAELTALENLYVLTEREQEMVFERKLELFVVWPNGE